MSGNLHPAAPGVLHPPTTGTSRIPATATGGPHESWKYPDRVNRLPSRPLTVTTESVPLRNGQSGTITYHGGRIASIHAYGMVINHGLLGGRTIVSERDGRRLVSVGRNRGFVERGYKLRNPAGAIALVFHEVERRLCPFDQVRSCRE